MPPLPDAARKYLAVALPVLEVRVIRPVLPPALAWAAVSYSFTVPPLTTLT